MGIGHSIANATQTARATLDNAIARGFWSLERNKGVLIILGVSTMVAVSVALDIIKLLLQYSLPWILACLLSFAAWKYVTQPLSAGSAGARPVVLTAHSLLTDLITPPPERPRIAPYTDKWNGNSYVSNIRFKGTEVLSMEIRCEDKRRREGLIGCIEKAQSMEPDLRGHAEGFTIYHKGGYASYAKGLKNNDTSKNWADSAGNKGGWGKKHFQDGIHLLGQHTQ